MPGLAGHLSLKPYRLRSRARRGWNAQCLRTPPFRWVRFPAALAAPAVLLVLLSTPCRAEASKDPRQVVSGNYIRGPFTYAVSADGERFLMFKDSDQPFDDAPNTTRAARLAIVENWFEELKEIKPTDMAN